MFPDFAEVGKYFHEMFRFRWDEYRRSGSILVVNPTKRRKKFADEEGLIYKPLDFEIFSTISTFGMFEISRLAVFEKLLRRVSYLHLHLQCIADSSAETSLISDDLQSRIEQSDISELSKVVKIGIRSIFELIKGSKTEHPDLCVRAVTSLFTILEGLRLEALCDEPSDIVGDIFNVLLNVVDECLNEEIVERNPDVNRLIEISSACLLSFAIIRGDTGKMLRAISAILISKYSLSHSMVLPNAVIELQKSVQSVITGKLKHPNWFTHGVLKSSCISSFLLLFTPDDSKLSLMIRNLACDGYYLYIYTSYGLYKIGTGYNGTIPRNVYAHNPAFFGQENGWIFYMKNSLYFMLMKQKGSNEFYLVNENNLELQQMIRIDTNVSIYTKGLVFVDGDYLCSLSSPKEDELVIRSMEIVENNLTLLPEELRFQLSEKYFKLFGSSCGSEEKLLSSRCVGVNEELISFASGKEFSLLQTSDGKVLYNSKLGNQNLRAPGTRSNQCWVELICPKMSTVKQCVIGNDGSIGLLVYNDGSVYFIGFARRGEDGENGAVRRQCNQIKPRKMTRMEGKNVVYAACNHGSTALVTDKGELYMFGKDAIHCDPGTGYVSDLKHVRVRSVALGKVHVVVLTDKGQVYTFGYNGRGQCGRFSSSEGPGRSEAYMEVYVEDDENSASSDDTYSDVICLKGTHIFKQDKCMICPICHQCTGYGAGCLASNEGDREPGEECGCGDGDSGCAKCCICKICAFEEDPDQELDDENEPDDIIRINLFGAVYERNDRKVRAELFKKEEEPIAGPSGEGRIKSVEMINNSNGGKDSMSMVYLLPAKVHFRTTAPATQIAAGLYHTVVLMENGEVYTFGSNTSGQLGINDENHIGPVKTNLPPVVIEVAAGSNHTVALTATGEVYTFGNNSKNQLGRNCVTFIQTEGLLWHSTPQLIPNIGSQYAQKVTGIGASGDLTYLKISESLLSRSTLNNSRFVADKNNILMLPVDMETDEQKTFECVVIEKKSGNFRNFANSDQVNFTNAAVCYDSLYNVLWCIHENEPSNAEKGPIAKCYNVVASDVHEEFCSPNILDCELALPVITMHTIPCYQAAVHVLACLDMLAQARSRKDSFKSLFMEQKRVINTKSLRKEDFIAVNRFQGLGNSWTYNAHNAVEAIRFSCDTDVLLGGIGLYGGRGHYHVRLKLLDIGYESDPEPKDGQILISTDEVVYECSLKQTYPFMFEEPVLLQANRWYIIWAQIKGSPSDCGSSGLPYLVTDDEVVFHFKSSLLSNNGTNVSSGQIPQLFYKVLLPEFYVVTNLENPPPAVIHILSRKFSHTVTEDGFKSLINLLSWCWEEFKMKYSEISNLRYSPLLLEVIRQFDKLVYINQACQHLIRAFIFEMYPDGCRVKERKSRMSYVMAELIGDVRELLQNILSDPFLFEHFIPKKIEDGSCNIFYKLVKHIIKECSSTFVACFYVFYPTPTQKWIYLSYLLSFEPENKFENDFLITATLSALCASNICLKLIFPILLGGFDPNQLFQENKNTNLASNFYNYNPVLAEVMMNRTEGEITISISSWLYVMGKLLEMASKPVEEALHGVKNYHDSKIALNSCQILSKLVAELSADAMGINVSILDEVQRRKDQMLHTTPLRFRRVNANRSWNTGNGSPDAICFTVDKPGVVIVGIAAFGGSGNYDYEIELLDEIAAKGKNNSDYNLSNPHANWRCIALSRGSFGSSDYSGKDMVELNFEYPTAIQENTKYIIKLRLRGNRTNNGELGQAVVTGPDDTVFNFISTEISFNGTSVSRGQLPYIIYYRYPQRTTQELRQKKFVENQAYEAIVTISNRIFSEITSILTLANESPDYKEVVDILVDAPIITALLPLLVTHLSPLVATNAKIACHVLKLIEELLPLVCQINKKIIANTKESTSGAESSSTVNFASNFVTTSPHYSLVESDHPYKRATVSKYIVKFPESVLWLSLEFDPRCGTAQEEDVLKIYVPDFSSKDHRNKIRKVYRPLPRTYGNDKHAWPGTAIILPGNEVIFSLESASKYLSRDRGTTFGFRCLVIGFEMVNIDGIPRLELELTSLACRCASYLIKKNFICSDDNADAINLELAEAEYGAHCSVLNRGIDLYRKGIFEYDKSTSFTRYRRMHADGSGFHIQNDINRLPTTNSLMDSFAIEEMAKSFSSNTSDSNEHSFLMDFINYKNDTSGGRLARWLQPDSFVDVAKCEMIFPRTKIKCGWPTTLAIVTRDQYGDIVEIPDLKVKVTCVPQQKEIVAVESKSKDHSGKPDLSIPYKATTVNKVRYSAMTMMKEFIDYSFEELRYHTPTITLENEHLQVQSNHNGIHTANWTPAGLGVYSIYVTIDGYPMKKLDLKVEVKDTPHGQSPPLYSKSSCIVYEEKKLRFGKQYSAGLRIRAQPSLQCEAVGFVEPGGIVTYIDEIENEDGVWVKLIHECITLYCKQLYPEGWCLKYHKHYDFELLQTIVNQNNANVPEKITITNDIKVYRVVKCGVSGHNIRAYPSLKAPTVGMIFSDQSVTSDEQIYNKEGMWIKLDKEAMKRFDLKQYDSVWSLAVDKSQIVYLRSDFSINKDMFLKALKWDEITSKVTGNAVVDSSSTSSDDSDNDHNHNPFSSEESQHNIYVQTLKDTGILQQKKKSMKSDRNVSVSPKQNIQNITTQDDECNQERSSNQNLNLTASVPPTPKKKRLGEHVPKITTPTLARMTSTSDLEDSESSPSSRAHTPQFGPFVDKFEKTSEISVIRISSMSDSSGAVSTSSGGYQASIDTSSDSVLMFASKISFEQEKLTVVQTGTQTSPKILPKMAINMKPDISMIKPQETISFNCTTASTCKSTEVEITDDPNKKQEPDRISRSSDDYSYEGMDSDDDLPSGIDDASSEEDHDESIIESPLCEKCKPETEQIKAAVENESVVASTSQQKCLAKVTESADISSFNFVQGLNKTAEADEIAEAIEWEKYYCIKDSKIKYKTGIRPSVAESVRAVFAAFLWHEGLAHDAMTCASYLKFYPELRKDFNPVVRREHNSNRNKDVTLRYSVEVGLIGNDHHLIKPSTMKSLPSAANDSSHKTNADGGSKFVNSEKNETSSSLLALECLVLLWNEISNTCFQLYSKNNQQSATNRSNDEKDLLKESTISSNSVESDDNKKCVYKLPINFYKRFGTEEICELCNGKYPSPVTYHMKSTHKGCGKANIQTGYSAEGKYTGKVKGTCGEGGVKGTPSYVLCEACRERHMQYRKFKTSMFQRHSFYEDGNSGPLPMHIIMKENALFALDLSSNCNKFLPMVSTMPKLKTFGCLAAFGIDGDVIPNEINSFADEARRRVRIKSDTEDAKANDDSLNIMKNFHRSVSMIGNSWMSNEDENNPPPSIPNKRYSALCDLESGNLSAMCQPSSRLQTVLKDLRSNMSESGSKMERPILAFLKECHNLRCLRTTMKSVMQKAIFKNYGLRAMDWLLRTVTMPIALHDIMWWFVSSFSVPLTEDNDYENDNEWKDEFDLTRICEHPLVDMALAGECRQQIPASFHNLLQTISDLMMIFPIGSPLQQMAIKCWGFQFTHSDYNFLHRSKLFVNISKILSRSENEEEPEPGSTSLYESHLSVAAQNGRYIQVLQDITAFVSITVSSQSQQIANLIDNSTETYWESGEEDRRKMKTIVINCPPEVDPRVIYVHVDNTRDPNHKVLSIMILTGLYADFPHKLKTINLDPDYCGWVTTFIPEAHQRMIRIDCKGDHVLRIRQIKVTGEIEGESPKILQQPSPFVLQQRQCESETLKVFRLIIFQVFGELIETSQSEIRTAEQRESSDLKEHMVGILFSRRKLNNLQKQVCNHIVQAIKKETCIIKEVWEKYADASITSNLEFHGDIADSYCFEMLCMVSALSGSDVGRSYLAQQYHLISDLLTLLHAGTARLQRQVVLLLKRVLPEVSPKTLALITDVKSLPPVDFHALAGTVTSSFDTNKRSILEIFLAVIAKILSIQVKTKNNGSGKGVKTVTIVDHLQPLSEDPQRWYLKGTVTKELASEIDGLLKDMSSGRISEAWQTTVKSAIAENLLNLANLCKIATDRNQCLKYATFWIGLSSLCGVDKDHVEKLSSANWKSEKEGGSVPRPLCSNHDDGKTLAIIQCNICELLCLECDRFLHLSRKSSHHERKVCKEEEEAIKVDVHECCGRIKLFWLLALVDSNTFKGVVEFRESSRLTGTYNRTGIRNEMCRFCGRRTNKLSDDGICFDEECQQHASNACSSIHPCGHICGGIKGEEVCLPCLHGCSSSNPNLKQDADDMCMICFTEALSAAPSIQLECGHVFHYHCCENALLKRWPGPRITFNFQQCPICKRSIHHESMKILLSPIWDLIKDVRKKALMRLEYEGCPSNYEDPATYAMEKYAYYVCFKCKKAYYGGEARCEAEVDNSDYNPEELICGGCSDISGARVCPKHGTDFLEYKCRYCCSVAVYFCFGTTHFCNACHEDFQNVITLLPSQLPSCPAGPKGTALNVEDCPLHIEHPPTGEEFALGCGVCRTGRNF